MSGFAVGLGGFMDGFTGGLRTRDAMDDRKRAKVIQERQDVEYNRSLDQRNAVDQINKDARSTFDAQVTAGTQKPDNFDQFWSGYALPKLKNTYLLSGDIENAKRVQEWGDSEDTKTGAKLFSGALLKAQTGDFSGALDDAVKIAGIKGYGNVGLNGLRYEPIVREAGGPAIGMRIYATGPDGKENHSDVPNEKIPEVIARFTNPEAAWQSQVAARAAADKEKNDLRQYEEKKKIDKQYGVGDTKQRGDAITSLRKRLDGGLAGDEKAFDDLPAEEKEKLIDAELELQRGQPGLMGVAPTAQRPEKKVLVDTVTGKQVQSAQPKPTTAAPAPAERKQKDDNATSSAPKKDEPSWLGQLVTGVSGLGGRASEGLARERKRLSSMAEEGRAAAAAPSPTPTPRDERSSSSAIAQAEAAIQSGAPLYDVAMELRESGVPESQWPTAIREEIRRRQASIGLTP